MDGAKDVKYRLLVVSGASHDTSVVAEWSNALDLNCASCIQLSSLFGGNGSNPFDGVVFFHLFSYWQMIYLSSCYMLEYIQKCTGMFLLSMLCPSLLL
jgi:hypothetical protein